MWRAMFLVCIFLSQIAQATDTYDFRNRCPQDGPTAESLYATNPNYRDGRNFPICQCTSYVAFKLNEHWGAGAPQFNNQYYSVDRWGNASEWVNRALSDEVQIGVTGGRDNFTWDENAYNAVFIGDVAHWVAWDYVDTSGQRRRNVSGHVAFVEGFTRDANGDLSCVTISDYNMTQHDYSRRELCRSSPRNAPPSQRFPDYFLHIDQDRSYCRENPTVDTCATLMGRIATAGLSKYVGGLGGGSDPFNLSVNDFWVKDTTHNLDLVPGADTVQTGEALEVRIQVKAKDGDTHDHMRPGKNSIEVDIYVREDLGDWRFLQREYIQATNLPSGATHTEHIDYTVPAGITEVSFKAKIDAEDEAFESNEGENWTEIQTFQVSDTPFYDLVITSLSLTTSSPAAPGSPMGARFSIRNIGNITPSMDTRSCYDIFGPGTDGLWQTIASDQSDGGTLVPGFDRWEEIHTLVPAPTVPGTYSLRVMANCTNGVPESDVSNNGYTIPLEIRSLPPNLVITRFEDKVGCCTTNTGAAPKPRIRVQNDGPVAPEANVSVVYQVSSPVATSGLYQTIGYGTIEPRELPPRTYDDDQMDCDGCWRIPKTSAWKKQWHTFRACLRTDGAAPVPSTGNPSPGEVCAGYQRYSRE